MIQALKHKLVNKLMGDNSRSQKIIKNILMSFGVKSGSILVGLVLIPLTINYIDAVQYGIWLTISSVVSWMNFFDIGMGNGLRNKLAAALALEEYDNARKYISTTYATLIIVATCLFILFCIVNSFVDWRGFLNIPSSVRENISLIVFAVAGAFCIQFIAQLINTVLTAIHEPAMAGVIAFLGQIMLLVAVIVLKYTVNADLLVLVIVLTCVPIIVLLIASIVLYNGKLKYLAPSLRKIDFHCAKSILNVGGIFFLIQIGTLIVFQTNNLIITKVIGPEAVTQFNVSYKLYSVIIMLFSIIMTPYWSAFTDAYAKNDFAWMRNSMNKLRKIWYLLSLIIIPLLVLSSSTIFKLWLGNTVSIPLSLAVAMGAYTICFNCVSLNCFFLNGLGKLRIQLLLYIITCVLNIPLGVFLGKIAGVTGVVLSNVLTLTFMIIVLWIQVNKILNNRAIGIWNA
jgi:O-antigen/teichoic acid export membrane protein